MVARFDSRGIHSPIHLVRIPFAELIKADWELPNTDTLIWIWQSVRGDYCPYRPNLPFRMDPPNPDLQNSTYSIRQKDIDSTKIAIDYGRLKYPHGMDTSFEGLSTSGKCDLLSRPGASPMAILRLLNLGAHRNTLGRTPALLDRPRLACKFTRTCATSLIGRLSRSMLTPYSYGEISSDWGRPSAFIWPT